MNNQVFSVAWWNTSLSHRGKSTDNLEDKAIAMNVINDIKNTNIDFIALGEISTENVKDILENCNCNNYSIFSGCEKAGKSYFDFCYIYNNSEIEIIDNRYITKIKNEKILKVAHKIDIFIKSSKTYMHIFVSHWPSRLHCSELHPNRDVISGELRKEIDLILEEYKGFDEPYIILMGDYNDEPYNRSLSEHVMASRDINFVRKKRNLLYNPFWKNFSVNENFPLCGSYYHKNGDISKWRTFDQIIYSHAFINSSDWKLVDLPASGNLLIFKDYIDVIFNNKYKFDHLPIIGLMERTV